MTEPYPFIFGGKITAIKELIAFCVVALKAERSRGRTIKKVQALRQNLRGEVTWNSGQ